MLESKELQRLGEKIAQDYLVDNTSMTQALEKTAADYGLNKNQVQRVAEVANVKTHLRLMKTAKADDAYIVFDVADASDIKGIEKRIEKEANFDYDQPPTRQSILDESESLFKTAGDITETEYHSPNEIFNKAVTAKTKIASLQNKVLEGSIRLESMVPPIYRLVKQAALSGTSSQDLAYVIKTAAPLGEYLIDELSTNLEKDRIDLDVSEETIEKYASRQINPDNELAKKVVDFNDEAVEVMKTAESLIEEKEKLSDENPIEKKAKAQEIDFGTKLAGVIKFVLDSPGKALVSGGGLYTVGRLHQAKIEKTSPLAQKNYNIQTAKR